MNRINRRLVQQCLEEFSSKSSQVRLWNSSGEPEVSSFSETLEQLFTDSGPDAPLHSGSTGFGSEFENILLELEKELMGITPHQKPDTLIYSKEMERVRYLADKALITLNANPPPVMR